MGKFSTYRYLELKDESGSPHINASIRGIRTINQPRKLKKLFFVLIILALCATYYIGVIAGQSKWIDGLAKSLGYESVNHYAVIVDAGSSGSRVLAYKFRIPFTLFGPTKLELLEEHFQEAKPGLSSYVDDPVKGADVILRLIKSAEVLVPLEKRAATPLLVRATAGLRLLPNEKAMNLCKEVEKAVATLGYSTHGNAVEIMDGSDEGIYIWYTVNLLHEWRNPMAALDLGGGSTQITYQLSDSDVPYYPTADQVIVSAGTNITLYTHSYLKLGLFAARLGILRLEAQNNTTETFTSVCVDPIVQNETWDYSNRQFIVNGASRSTKKREAVYKTCHEVVRRYVLQTMDWEPKKPPKGNIAAMSYFYDVAADAGLIDVESGGSVYVHQYRGAALTACSASNVEQPWACLDLTYIVTLLQDGYKLPEARPISLFKKVNGHEVSWALGLAYTTVMNRIATAIAAA